MDPDHNQTVNPKQLAAFRAVIVSGSVTGAGKILHVTQPAVTRLIKDLESQLGLTLFTRRAGRMTPTAHAQTLYRNVERYFFGLERVLDAARTLRNNRGGQLRIAAMPTLSSRTLPEAIGRFRRRYPEIDIAIESEVSIRILDAVMNDEVDLGIGRVPKERDDLARLDMPTSEAICILPKHHHLAERSEIFARDLSGEPMVTLGASSLLRLQVDSALRLAGVVPGSTIQTLFSNTASTYVANGLGIAVVDLFSILGADLSQIEIRRFNPRITFDFAAVYPDGHRSPLAIAFARELRDVVSDEISDMQDRLAAK
ncbi:MAG: LysR family transcriptional regulator [Devosia sp.]|jgi:DNA-binding transcriptional LysR family regulator|nr:LysR family transcriptional regulator [Devosia sp.]